MCIRDRLFHHATPTMLSTRPIMQPLFTSIISNKNITRPNYVLQVLRKKIQTNVYQFYFNYYFLSLFSVCLRFGIATSGELTFSEFGKGYKN